MYRALLWASFKRVLQYPWAILLYISFTWINMALSISVWIIAARSGSSYILSQESVSHYFFLLLILVPLIQSYSTGYVSHEQIKKGEMTSYLVKPISFFWSMFLLEVPWRIMSFIYSIPVIILYYALLRPTVVMPQFVLCILICLIPLCYLYSFIIEMIIAYLALFFEDTKGFEHVHEVLSILFSGAGLPLFAFPPVLAFISLYLPFRYYLYDLIRIFQGAYGTFDIVRYLLVFVSWFVLLVLIERLLWNKGLRNFTGEGR